MILEKGFIEKVDLSKFTLYSDTDSSYSLVPLPFSKFEDHYKTVEYAQDIALELNKVYLKTFEETVVKYGGVNPQYNFMDFKSEIVAYRGFFNTKKNYGLAKLWDEGTYYDPPDIKKVGGQISKADSTPIVLDLLQEVYALLLKDFKITDEIELYHKIFYEIKNKYLARTEKSVYNFNIHDFGIPKKWSLKTLKSIPKQVEGALLYNYIFGDVFRPGESVLQIQARINSGMILREAGINPPKGEFQTTIENITPKMNVISFPVNFGEHPDDVKNTREVFEKYQLQFDLQTILDFNVNLKLEQFQKLFSERTRRLAI